MSYWKSCFSSVLKVTLLSSFVFGASTSQALIDNPVYRSKLNLDFSLLFSSQAAWPGFNFGGDYVFNGPQYLSAGKYFAVGGRFDAYFHGTAIGTVSILDISPYGKFQYAFDVPSGYLGIRIVIPIGVSIGVINNRAQAGWNLSILPGVDYFFDEHWGIFTEFGFSFHGFPTITDGGASGEWNVGVNYAF